MLLNVSGISFLLLFYKIPLNHCSLASCSLSKFAFSIPFSSPRSQFIGACVIMAIFIPHLLFSKILK